MIDESRAGLTPRSSVDITTVINSRRKCNGYVEAQKELLLGLNCHQQPKFDRVDKVAETELLLQSLLTHETDAIDLRNNPDIIVRRADKSSIYVILNKEDYLSKLDLILSDTTKFKKISSDPTSKLKVTTPTYRLAKQINSIITPYIPKKYSLRSIDEFLDILHSTKPQGIMASLDVQSLFTHVPILPTINTIMDNVYHHPQLPPPKIPENILKQLLIACTTEAPFRSPTGHLFYQIEGVAMGSPLGCTFAEFYMCNLENSVLQNPDIRPHLYHATTDKNNITSSFSSEILHITTPQ
ncbi:uncharacterized protein LOC143017947 [Oratosquilla oratoria]|uniref:uncharacterized protein LOC143017947 n=1 Tax=Oratosquilla oratoria TaxID=337810 RepID=UPI003F77014E